MHVTFKKNPNKIAFNGILNNKILTKGLELAGEHGALFAAGTSVILSTVARPLAILAAPNVEKENKQYACAKSLSSSLVNFGLIALVSAPIVKAVQNISNNPQKFLSQKTINALKQNSKTLSKAKPFRFASQIFKLSATFLTALPKAFLTCAFIPPLMDILFNKQKNNKQKSTNISFGKSIKPNIYNKFSEKISKGLSKILNTKKFQNFTQKYHNTNIAQHMFCANDILLTGLFINQTKRNKNIKENRKKTLIYNSAIATAISVIGGYTIDKLLQKPTEIFIKKFKEANKGMKNIEKCIDGINIAKTSFVLGSLYYIIAPFLTTILAETITNKKNKDLNK